MNESFHAFSVRQYILSGLPLVFALLPDKTQSTYETLFHHVLTQCEVNGLRTIPRSTRDKTACLRELFTQYSTGHHTRLDYLQRVGYQFAPSS